MNLILKTKSVEKYSTLFVLKYSPEAIPNAIDLAIKGDFKDDDGSYSDTFSKFINGLNPLGDARDVALTANELLTERKALG